MYVYYCLDLVKSCVRGRGDNGHVLRLAAACVEVVSQEEEEGGTPQREKEEALFSYRRRTHAGTQGAREQSQYFLQAAIAFLPAVCGGQTSSDRVVLR